MNSLKINLLDAVEESFSIYAAMTIQDRAIVDARDGLKPAPRQCMYAQYLDKITYKKPFKKSAKSVSAAMDHFYVHGRWVAVVKSGRKTGRLSIYIYANQRWRYYKIISAATHRRWKDIILPRGPTAL